MNADTDRDDVIVFFDDDGNVVLVLPADDVDAIIPDDMLARSTEISR
jgi:hypothetical protein